LYFELEVGSELQLMSCKSPECQALHHCCSLGLRERFNE
jgi:hypothetical protein